MNAAKILIALGLLVAACSGQAPALQANVTATPLPVPTAVVPSVIVDLSMECNYILALSTFVGTDSKLAAISDRNLFQELGEKPSLLRDEAFVNEAATIAEAKFSKSQIQKFGASQYRFQSLSCLKSAKNTKA